jgi:ribonuclease HI
MEGWFDGGSRGNPGIAGAGWLLKANGALVQCGYVYLGSHSTNNEAEYTGLVSLLQAAVALNVQSLVVHGDSLLVIQQMKGAWQVRDPRMRALHYKAKHSAANIPEVEFRHVLRHRNAEADLLSNMAMDQLKSAIGKELLQSAVPEPAEEEEAYEGPTCAVRIRREAGKVVQGCDVWVGSAWAKGGWCLKRSKWYHPFSHLPDREMALAMYKKHIQGQPDLDFTELKGKRLGCFCDQPDPFCHAAWLATQAI